MEVWMFKDIYFVNKNGLGCLQEGRIYNLPDNIAQLIIKHSLAGEYVRIK